MRNEEQLGVYDGGNLATTTLLLFSGNEESSLLHVSQWLSLTWDVHGDGEASLPELVLRCPSEGVFFFEEGESAQQFRPDTEIIVRNLKPREPRRFKLGVQFLSLIFPDEISFPAIQMFSRSMPEQFGMTRLYPCYTGGIPDRHVYTLTLQVVMPRKESVLHELNRIFQSKVTILDGCPPARSDDGEADRHAE